MLHDGRGREPIATAHVFHYTSVCCVCDISSSDWVYTASNAVTRSEYRTGTRKGVVYV
jgi:hypothetical protein